MNNYFSPAQQTRLNNLEQIQQQLYPVQYSQQKINNVTYDMINGYEAAKSYPVPPGKAGLLFDNQQNEFYMKSVDAIGMQTLKKFEYKEVALPSTSSPAIANDFSKRLDSIENALAILLQEKNQKNKKESDK